MRRKVRVGFFVIVFMVVALVGYKDISASTHTEFGQMVNEIRGNLRNHETSFLVETSTTVLPDDLNAYASDALCAAWEHTGNSKEGDYIRWNISGSGYETSYVDTGAGYTISISYDIAYFTTKDQEAEVDEKIEKILAFLDLEGKSDYEKILTIYSYICHNVSYDWEGLDDDTSKLEHSTYAAICKEKAVCQGYATAMYRLLLESDIDCRVIAGENWGVAHAWNLIELDGKYYTCDPSSDAGKTTFDYFLKSRSDCANLVEYEEYGTEDFLREYPLTEASYEASTQALVGEMDGFKYSLSVENLTILSYAGDKEDVVVPAEINGLPVKTIGYEAFFSLPNMKTLTFSEGIESISSLFAYGCDALETIYIPSTACLGEKSSSGFVTGLSGFVNWCTNVKQVVVAEGNPYLCVENDVLYNTDKTSLIYYPSALANETFVVPDSVERIEDDSFAYHPHIKEVVLPDTVTYIGYWAFNNSTLEKINLPSACRVIGQYAFNGTRIKEIYISAEFKADIVANVFSYCEIEKIEVEAGNERFSVCDNALIYEQQVICFANASMTESCRIPDDVVDIQYAAFWNAKNLKHIFMPRGLRFIGWSAFEGCSGLEELTIPSSVVEIERTAFCDCSSIKKLVVPNGITTINSSTFLGCRGLEEITIPKSVTVIDNFAFGDCVRLKKVYYTGSKEEWNLIEISDDNKEMLIDIEVVFNHVLEHTHSYVTNVMGATCTEGGYTVHSCNVCGASYRDEVTAAKGHSFDEGIITKQPTYTEVGKRTYTCKTCGETRSETIAILKKSKNAPKGTKLVKVSGKKKSFTVTWKKQTKKTTGYEIQYSTSKKFKNAQIASVKKNKQTSVTIKRLKAKKKYYVRIRTYKEVKGVKYYSDWSAVKTVKTKK